MSDVFLTTWQRVKFEDEIQLCYNTGRLVDDTLRLVNHKLLPEPDYLICGVGTAIYDYRQKKVIKEFAEVLEEGWNRDQVHEVISSLSFPIEPQPDHYQNDFKSSWYFDDADKSALQAIKTSLKSKGLEVNVIYSSNRDLDILPRWANKGHSLEWLLAHLNIPAKEVIVGGNSGNDSAMFKVEGVRGIVVANAQPELIQETKAVEAYLAQAEFHEGILEGLNHYGVSFQLEDEPDPYDEINVHQVNLMTAGQITGLTGKETELIRQGYEKAIEAIRKNITPLGFSACSLEDNKADGTDINYRSVWARDGAITIIGTLPVHSHADIHQCQRNTLSTILEHLSPSGQVPAYVRIDTKQPDYSGVGGICSIDSGLWIIIAMYEFVKASGDIELLRQHFHRLTRVMNWLSAHDGNNDSLLEIPEASDWTDLFGRSYNVLYDEVLWYRVNICFGRMLELMGHNEQAGDYLTWSQVIKQSILYHFWPTTKSNLPQKPGFDEKQYSLGDARYLIAQITPFDFSWRCDVYGNVLAHLFNVLDKEKATTMFRFIWGAGANQPYPVKNVYPAVYSGDSDWRPYYTVNLLNLPNHYHNGGIWPFVGGAWVRSIHKLGLRDIALQELYKLAELNKLGIFNEWEFNEWAHGITGKPMGKSFQAWSAAEYILACHALKIID